MAVWTTDIDLGESRSFTLRDEVQFSRIIKSNRRETLVDITSGTNEAKVSTFCSKTVRKKEIFEMGCNRRVENQKMIVRCVSCCREKHWTVDYNWKNLILSNVCKIETGNNNRVYIWQKIDENDIPDFVCAPSKSKLSVMIWGCIRCEGVATLASVKDTFT